MEHGLVRTWSEIPSPSSISIEGLWTPPSRVWSLWCLRCLGYHRKTLPAVCFFSLVTLSIISKYKKRKRFKAIFWFWCIYDLSNIKQKPEGSVICCEHIAIWFRSWLDVQVLELIIPPVMHHVSYKYISSEFPKVPSHCEDTDTEEKETLITVHKSPPKKPPIQNKFSIPGLFPSRLDLSNLKDSKRILKKMRGATRARTWVLGRNGRKSDSKRGWRLPSNLRLQNPKW